MIRTKESERIRDKRRYSNEAKLRRARSLINLNLRRMQTRKLMLQYLKNQKCLDCGNNNIIVFEFDHVRGLKSDGIGNMLSRGKAWKDIVEEIKKCDIVCANCHRERTFLRNKCYRNFKKPCKKIPKFL